MIHRLCASCGRNPERGIGRHRPHRILVNTADGIEIEIAALCHDCADSARFSVNQLADAIIAEFQRQLSPSTTNQKEQP